MPRVNDLAFLPHGVFADFFRDKVLEHFVQPVHELRAGRDAIGVKTRLFGKLLALGLRSHLQLFGLNSRSESKSTRDLVHNFFFFLYLLFFFFRDFIFKKTAAQLFGLNSRSESKSTRDLLHNFYFIIFFYFFYFIFFFLFIYLFIFFLRDFIFKKTAAQLFGLNSWSESKSTRDLFHNFFLFFYFFFYFFFFLRDFIFKKTAVHKNMQWTAQNLRIWTINLADMHRTLK